MKSTPSRSSPPPSLPRDLVARARIETETEELSPVASARTQALLAFELGALHEHGLGDSERAAEHYRRAIEHRPAFWPSLFALARLYEDAARPADAAAVWELLARTSRVPADAAAALCEAGLLLYDRLTQSDQALLHWNEALTIDSSCVCAALLIEQHHRAAHGHGGREARRAVEAHADALTDPEFEAALLCELAAADERAGDVESALARLAQAGELAPSAHAVFYETERIARRHGRWERLADALAILALRERGSKARSVALLCDAARTCAVRTVNLRGARALYDRAIELVPDDALARWERLLLHRALGQPSAAIADARALLEAAPDGPLAAALRVRLAELLQATDDPDAALEQLQAAGTQAPHSAAVTAALQDALLRAGRFEALHEHLTARAARSRGPARSEHLLRAARIALISLGEPYGALELIERAANGAERPQGALRSLFAAAVFAGDQQRAIDAAARLCQTELDATERSLLRFDQWHRVQRFAGEPQAASALLESLLDEPELADWAPQAARLQGAGAHDYRLLARAHQALAAEAGDDAGAAAHLCAAARGLLRAGEPRAAAEQAYAALGRAPDDAYALALLEESLLLSGGEREAAALLREAAQARATGKQRELALLHAGAAAEAAGDVLAAGRSYEEAAELDRGSLAPRWALLRLAERSRDRPLLMRALTLLSLREQELGGSGLCSLELGELLSTQGLGQPASGALRIALGRADSHSAAALDLCLLPEGELDAELRDRAIGAMAELCGSAAGLPFLRDGLATRPTAADGGARALLDAALAEHGRDPGLALHALATSQDDVERADALLQLARAADDPDAGAELVLHGLRVALLAEGEAAADDVLLRALAAVQAAPHSLAAAVALDEALWAGDDAESRVTALAGRLAHSNPESSHDLRAAHARALFAAGRPRAAAERARAALEHDPDDLALWELWRAAARAIGDFEAAADAAERLAQAADGSRRCELLEEAAVLLQNELGQSERAERCLRDAFDHDPSTQLAFAWLHDLLLERRDLPGLLELVERRIGAQSDADVDAELGYERALLLRASGRKDDAIAALEQLLERDPRHMGALGLLVETCTAGERWQAAVNALRKLAEADVPEAQRRLARIGAAEFLERRLDDVVAACVELETLVTAAPDDADLQARLAGLYERAGRFRQAVSGYVHAASLERGSAAAGHERSAGAILHQRLGALGEAIEAYDRALSADPLDADACAALLELHDRGPSRDAVLERFADALAGALEREPTRPQLLRLLRRVGQWRGRSDIELIALRTLRALGPLEPSDVDELERLERTAPRPRALDAQALARLAGAAETVACARIAQLVSAALAAAQREAGGDPIAVAKLGDAASPEQRFEAGAQAMAQHLGVLALQQRTRAAQRDALRAGLALSGSAKSWPDSAALGKQLAKQLARAERKELTRAAAAIADPEAQIDAYLEALDTACLRAGLLAADDPRPALARALAGARVELEPAALTPRALALLRFWLSPSLLVLRRELGWTP